MSLNDLVGLRKVIPVKYICITFTIQSQSYSVEMINFGLCLFIVLQLHDLGCTLLKQEYYLILTTQRQLILFANI